MRREELLDRLLSLVFPARCVMCGKVVEYDTLWCSCEIDQKSQIIMLGNRLECTSSFVYDGAARDLVLRFKKERDLRTAHFIAEHILEEFSANVNCDIIIPVPPKEGAQQKDHAYKISAELAFLLNLPLCSAALGRTADSRIQHYLTREERMKNAKESYYAKQYPLKEKRVLLVDDIVTTGATLLACTEMLFLLGATEVKAVTFATTTEIRKEVIEVGT